MGIKEEIERYFVKLLYVHEQERRGNIHYRKLRLFEVEKMKSSTDNKGNRVRHDPHC